MGDLSKDIQSTFPSNKVKALINIKYTANWIENHQTSFFKPYRISVQQYNVLRILKGANEPLRVQTIKDRMIQKAPNTTRLMDKLSIKNLIVRTACPNDRRVVHIIITKEGVSLLDKIHTERNDNLLKKLSEKEAKQLSDLLDKIR